MASSIPNPSATSSQSMPILWKDIWWIQGIVFISSFLMLNWSYKGIAFLARLLGYCRQSNNGENFSSHLSWSTVEDFSTENPNIIGDQTDQVKPTDEEPHIRSDANGRDLDEFHDLSHHGIQFYNDNISMSSRQRIPRMHSTVTEATLVSMMRHRQSQGGPTPPAFPKFQVPLNAYEKISLKTPICSGDARFAGQMEPSSGRLSTVAEEETSDGVMSYDRLSCKSEPSGRKKLDYSNAMKTGNNMFTARSNVGTTANFVVMKSMAPSGINKTGYGMSEDVKQTACEFSADYDPKEDIFCTNTVQLECLICKNKIQCVCDNCSSLGTALQHEKKDVHQDFSQLQEEFIDDNFEDMESIISNEVTECSNM